jgi:hypothetical protein
MSESFTLSFLYKGIPQEIDCTLRVSRFKYQFLCSIDKSEMILEKDDEGNFRAMDSDPFSNKSQKPDPGLVRALMDELERVLSE